MEIFSFNFAPLHPAQLVLCMCNSSATANGSFFPPFSIFYYQWSPGNRLLVSWFQNENPLDTKYTDWQDSVDSVLILNPHNTHFNKAQQLFVAEPCSQAGVWFPLSPWQLNHRLWQTSLQSPGIFIHATMSYFKKTKWVEDLKDTRMPDIYSIQTVWMCHGKKAYNNHN